MVRRYVIRRAQGKCELCGKLGFIMPDGRRYLETHHILSLATNGADSVDNVIGLCADHHREAHYGIGADSLNDRMLDILRNRGVP
jgi:5-methylcytosine-specific restriction protein A